MIILKLFTWAQHDVSAITYPCDYLGQDKNENILFQKVVVQVSFHVN